MHSVRRSRGVDASRWGRWGRLEAMALDAASPDAVVRGGDGREGGDDKWGHPVSERGERRGGLGRLGR